MTRGADRRPARRLRPGRRSPGRARRPLRLPDGAGRRGRRRGAGLRLGAVEVRPHDRVSAGSTSSVTACAAPSRCSRRASPDAGEDDGWVITLAHDTATDESTLLHHRRPGLLGARRSPRSTCRAVCPTARTAAGSPTRRSSDPPCDPNDTDGGYQMRANTREAPEHVRVARGGLAVSGTRSPRCCGERRDQPADSPPAVDRAARDAPRRPPPSRRHRRARPADDDGARGCPDVGSRRSTPPTASRSWSGWSTPRGAPDSTSPTIRAAIEGGVDYLNQHGGIGGRPIELETCIVNGSPETSQACAQELIGKGVELVLLGLDLFPDYATYTAAGRAGDRRAADPARRLHRRRAVPHRRQRHRDGRRRALAQRPLRRDDGGHRQRRQPRRQLVRGVARPPRSTPWVSRTPR